MKSLLHSFKALPLALLILGSLTAWSASDCGPWKFVTAPQVAQNAEFWHAANRLIENGEMNDSNLLELLEKYGVDAKGSSPHPPPAANITAKAEATSVTSSKVLRADFSKSASKQYEYLPQELRAKVDEFIDVTSIQGDFLAPLKSKPGWHFEKLKQGEHYYSIRLNHGYRLAFHVDSNQLIRITSIDKVTTHGGH